MSRTPISLQAAKLLVFLKSYIEENGYSPDYAECAAHMNFKAASSVSRLIDHLVDNGKIRILRKYKRRIEICQDMSTVTVPLPRQLASRLFLKAKATGRTREAIVSEALARYFAGPRAEKEAA